MNILYLLIILILLVIFYQTQKKNIKREEEKFTDNIFSHVSETNNQPHEDKIKSVPMDISNIQPIEKPDYIPHKVSDYYYFGKLLLHPYNEPVECYLYGKPIEAVHNLYSYYVFFIEDKKIKKNFSLNPHKKFKLGDPIFIRDGPNKEGPYFLS